MENTDTLDKLLGTFFFWAVITSQDKHKEFHKGIDDSYVNYLNEKSERYFGLPININFPTIYNKLRGINDPLLDENDVMKIIEATDKIWGMDNIYFDFTMYGDPEWLKTKHDLVKEFSNGNSKYSGVMSVLCVTFGVSITLGDKLGEIFMSSYKRMDRNMKINTLVNG